MPTSITYSSKYQPINLASPTLPDGFSALLLQADPPIIRMENFVTPTEALAVQQMAEGNFVRSTIVVDGKIVNSSTRTSQTAYITDQGHVNTYSRPVERILARVCAVMAVPRSRIEQLMVVKYDINEQYYNHFDFFEPEHTEQLASGGQRIATFFIYLNEPEAGGSTEFPRLGINARLKQFGALFWWNMALDGTLQRDTEHRGNPVTKGRKFGMNIWIREKGW